MEKSKNKNLNKDLHRAHRNGEKLLGLVNELLDLSKLENGQLQVKNAEVHLFNFITRIIGSFGSIAHIRKIKISLDFKLEKEMLVSVDPEKLEKVLTNLISNAIKFSRMDSDIFVRVVAIPLDRMHISVKDQGQGIAPSDQQRIFERYYQADHGSSVQGGTGIGLALVSELVELMGGGVQIESTVGEGSTFTIDLPYIQKAALRQKVKVEELTGVRKCKMKNMC